MLLILLFQNLIFFSCIPASAADAAVANLNGSKTFLTYGLAAFFINGKSILVNGIRKFRNPADCIILDN